MLASPYKPSEASENRERELRERIARDRAAQGLPPAPPPELARRLAHALAEELRRRRVTP